MGFKRYQFLKKKKKIRPSCPVHHHNECGNNFRGKEFQSEDKKNLFPNCDVTIWLRSCEKEVTEPIQGVITGTIPKWIDGCLLRNGPGNLKVGDMEFQHLFDSSALLHK